MAASFATEGFSQLGSHQQQMLLVEDHALQRQLEFFAQRLRVRLFGLIGSICLGPFQNNLIDRQSNCVSIIRKECNSL